MSQTQFGQVPKHWKVMPLEKCAFVQTGAAKGRKLGDSNTVTLPYLRVANVQDGHLDLTEIKTIRIRESEIERYRLQLGDVVLTEGGDFDKLGRGFIWQEQISDCIHQNHIFAVRPNRDILLPEYLSYLIQSGFGKAYFLSVAHRTTNLASINSTKLKAFPTLIPPLAEQRAIAHTLLTIQKAKEARQRELELERERKAALMQYLFTHGTRNEPRKKTELGDIPESWQVVKLGKVCKFLQYGTSKKCDLDSSGLPVLRIPNVIGGKIDTGDLKFVKLSSNEVESLMLKLGDLLFVRTNGRREYTGRCAVYSGEPQEALFASYLIRARLDTENLLPEFAQFYSMTYQGKKYLSERASSASDGKFNINTQTIKSVLIPKPNIDEQGEIINALQASDHKITALEQEAVFLDELFRAMLEELMTGQLSTLPIAEN